MKNKTVILCDIDGVIINGRPSDNKRWCEYLDIDLGVDISRITEEFFNVHWKEVIRGKKSLKPTISNILSEMYPKVDTEVFLKYWFENDSGVDNNLLNSLKKLKNSGKRLYLATDQEHERKNYLYHTLGLNKTFEDIFYSAEFGYTKSEDGYWRTLKEKLTEFNTNDMLFIDDRQINIDKAKEHGIEGYLYTNFANAIKDKVF